MRKLFPLSIIACLLLLILWQILSADTSYYLVSVAVLILSMLPFLISFEREKPSSRELTLIAGLTALAIVSRAVFYLLPQIKPIAAIVAISGVCLGAKRGYIVGCFSMFISNFIFGQGVWTPFQMVAMGMIGLLFGVIFKKLAPKRLALSVVGFISVLIYGLIVDTCSAIFLCNDLNISSILTVYGSGMIFNLIFAVTTFVCLFIFGEEMTAKINRINIKYGIANDILEK